MANIRRHQRRFRSDVLQPAGEDSFRRLYLDLDDVDPKSKVSLEPVGLEASTTDFDQRIERTRELYVSLSVPHSRCSHSLMVFCVCVCVCVCVCGGIRTISGLQLVHMILATSS